MLTYLRPAAIVVTGSLAAVFMIMSFVSIYTNRGVVRKFIQVSALYMALSIISFALTLILSFPTKAPGVLLLLVLGLLSVALYVGCSYFNLALVEKGPRKMLASLRQFLRHLLTGRDSE